MKNEVIAPINHGPVSMASTTAVETAKGGFGGLFKGAFAGFLGSIAAGAVLFAVGGAAIGLFLAPVFGAGAILTALGSGAALGAGVGFVGSFFGGIQLGAGLGTVFGGLGGASRGLNKVGQERGAATMLSAQVEAVKAQNAPQTVVMAHPPVRDASFPAQGSPMNQAGSTVFAAANDNAYAAEAARAHTQGTVAGAELSAARA